MADVKIGKVTHFYDKLGVAILDLNRGLNEGDKVKFVRGGEDLFEQVVESMQVEHKKVTKATKGDVIGLKVTQPVKEGADVYKLE